MRNKKIISALLIYCLLVQTLLIDAGCRSFLPAGENDALADYKNYEYRILLKLKDNTFIIVAPDNFIFVDQPADLIFGEGSEYNYKTKENSDFIGTIEKKDIDSNLVTGRGTEVYHLFWTVDSKKYTFEKDNFISIIPDSGKNFWIVRDYYNGRFSKITDDDISEIKIEKTNWILTSLLIFVSAGLILIGILFFGLENANGNE